MKVEVLDSSREKFFHAYLCLDYLNSMSNHHRLSESFLNAYVDLVSWGLDIQLLSKSEAQKLYDIASRETARANAIYQKAVDLREAVYRILSDTVNNQEPQIADLDELNAALSEAMAHMRLAATDSGFGWQWDKQNLAFILWQAAWSTGELMRSDELKHLRKCEGCGGVFLDTSRNHSRRWCDMKTCGNRAKARRHYKRVKGE